MSSFEMMLRQDKHNATRLEFVARFAEWAGTQPPALIMEVYPWIAKHRERVLTSLRKPETSECKALLGAARASGGVRLLDEV